VSDEIILPDSRFSERELSWLDFNQRVLELAEDESIPLLERVHFLSIFASNLDEFFMVRVASLKRRIATGIAVPSASGQDPQEVIEEIAAKNRELQNRHAEVFKSVINPQLDKVGIDILHWSELSETEKQYLNDFYESQIFPVLTPLAVDPAHPFPYISGLSLNLAVVLRNPKNNSEHFARVKVPPLLPRFAKVPESEKHRFVPLEDIIGENLQSLFPGMEVVQHHTFTLSE